MLKSDARKVLARVQACASGMRLRGARKAVLAAVLVLLPARHSRITDDAVRLYQIADLIVEAGGRRYCDKTIGRALASLAADELIAYTPAQGRGNRALVAIHSRFVDDVEVLQRDATGRVIVPESVTFSDRPSSYRPKAKYPPTPRSTADKASSDSRPTGVEIHPHEVREVFTALPEAYQDLSTRTRWRLGGLIRRQLGRGWLPEQIIAILAAPLPGGVKSPLHLAMWRLAKNQPGSGPRLRPLQQAWDVHAAAAERARRDQAIEQALAEITQATTADQRDRALRAEAARFGPITNPKTALVSAARAAVRRFPNSALATALGRWADTILDEQQPLATAPEHRPSLIVADLGVELAISTVTGHCVSCQAAPGTLRTELPIPVPVCDTCWTANADQDAA
ncbi:hypothetical protein A5742_17445 [Mycolicibacterium fortuitum]|uniref:Helix-turn-helix domain-containing protein n=1 Tax=Mycolicibacterium fortuitum TaxID=1766 RepID=A0ABD6QU58_MYCFO|nr:hypothetical protein [Mycolicibacterium fortuitum]OMC51922.1 hypothetical protein A5742_17445 [Mycolicibacterium fortuitum]